MSERHLNALATSIDTGLAQARELINDAWQPLMQESHLGADTKDEIRVIQQQLDWQLGNASEALMLLLELLGAPRAVERFISRWTSSNGQLVLALDAGDMEDVSCPRFEIVKETFESLVPVSAQTIALRAKQEVVKEALESTPKIVKASKQVPKSETDLHTIVHEHMEATFPDYLRKAAIAASPKYYIPDGAFPTLELGIEWKYVRDRTDLKRAIDEVKTDMASYQRSPQFTRFFGVFYQASSSICTPRELTGAFGKFDSSWEMILVTAP